MQNESRRQFLKTTATASVAAAQLGSSGIAAAQTAGSGDIRYRPLGSTGYNVSEIGFGAMNTRDAELVNAAIDSGINYIDTAHAYMNGVNEQIVGEVMKTKRDKVFLTTKLGSWENMDRLPEMMETSLKRLNTDHVDLVLLHVVGDRSTVMNERYQEIFDSIRRKGQTRFIGLSTHANQAAVLDAVVESEFWEGVLVGYNYFSPPEVGESIKNAREAGIAIIGMKNLLNPSTDPWEPLGDIRKDTDTGMTHQQALIRWVLDNPGIDTTVPGMTTFEHLADDLKVMRLKLTSNTKRMLRRLAGEVKDHYCCGVSGCTGCKDQCPKGVAVNEINRCLRYVNGYNDIELAREQYRTLPKTANLDVCAECDECTVTCINGQRLTETISAARRLFA